MCKSQSRPAPTRVKTKQQLMMMMMMRGFEGRAPPPASVGLSMVEASEHVTTAQSKFRSRKFQRQKSDVKNFSRIKFRQKNFEDQSLDRITFKTKCETHQPKNFSGRKLSKVCCTRNLKQSLDCKNFQDKQMTHSNRRTFRPKMKI